MHQRSALQFIKLWLHFAWPEAEIESATVPAVTFVDFRIPGREHLIVDLYPEPEKGYGLSRAGTQVPAMTAPDEHFDNIFTLMQRVDYLWGKRL
jgi:hypothetical protein